MLTVVEAVSGPSSPPLVVRLPPSVLRRIRALLEQPGAAYADLSDFLLTAAENQLALDGANGEMHFSQPRGNGSVGSTDAEGEPSIKDLLTCPATSTGPVGEPHGHRGALFVLTNRLSPLPVAARVLVNVTQVDGAQGIRSFVDVAARVARDVALRLKESDKAHRRTGIDRAAVGWPTGSDEAKALDRFRSSFLLERANSGVRGPMVDLGLVAVAANKVLPTELAARLAGAPSATLGEVDGHPLGAEQQSILREAVLTNDAETTEVGFVLAAIIEAGGVQERLDAAIQELHSDWTENRSVAHRAAALGRLRDLGIVEVYGQGPQAHIEITPPDDDFVDRAIALARGAQSDASVG